MSEAQTTKEKLWNSNYLKALTANFMLFFSFMLLNPLLAKYLKETFGIGESQIGLILCGYSITALVARLFSGYIVDSFPRKKILILCYALVCLFFGGYAIAGSLLLFAIVRTLHGAPFGSTTVANSTVAIDVLPSSRRNEGIGYYGLSNNIATAISPTIGLYILVTFNNNYTYLFLLCLLISLIGLGVASSIKLPKRETVSNKQTISLDRFFLLKGWSEGLALICFAFSYSVIATYLVTYGEELHADKNFGGIFFLLLSLGLIMSRLAGSRTLRQGKVTQNASVGMLISVVGYLIFAAVHNVYGPYAAALIIGLGNGHMYPAFQTMFINLAPNNQRGTANSSLLTSWDVGFGIGVLIGGVLARHICYGAAFWMAFIINLAGVTFYFAYVRKNFLRNKLR